MSPILPGAWIGILGSGQLGRMLAIAAKQMGYRVAVFSPDSDTPAGQVADAETTASYEDLDAVRRFAKSVSVVTFEFENVPSATTAAAAEHALVRPDGRVLHITQQRLREKNFLKDQGFPVAPFRAIRSRDDLRVAAAEIGLPAVLKTASFGYDGKGQKMLRAEADLEEGWLGLRGAEGIYEGFIHFEKELSVVGARTVGGEFRAFPVFENSHAHHILDITFAPADITPDLAAQARELARGILDALDVVGLLTVEMFLTRDGRLLVNELAPRTHNSGHLTLDACVTSQFEQQLRAVCGLPLGSTEMKSPSAMANLLGGLWSQGVPDWAAALASDPAVKLHLYGKSEARDGRKMGHLTVTSASVAEAVRKASLARSSLVVSSPG
ncbi:MAG: 5-(carboxyamino)imidazole ribonucleotide synthase [Verrucomicrobia bacterium]|nr:5-(carboxyamino)imidazole ribonucleotide synthase [Verrucomicrobiota bacterium]